MAISHRTEVNPGYSSCRGRQVLWPQVNGTQYRHQGHGDTTLTPQDKYTSVILWQCCPQKKSDTQRWQRQGYSVPQGMSCRTQKQAEI